MSNKKASIIGKKAFIFNIQKYNMYDGPGIRTMVFFKGCPLRCKWCSNPEGLELKYQVMFKNSSCVDCGACVSVCPVGIHTITGEGKHAVNRSIDCTGCYKCKEVCIKAALSIAGEVKTVSELLEIIKEDMSFYDISGGGVTLGGGEVMLQAECAANLLKACKQEGINTAVETCGYAELESILRIAEFTDLFLYDLKHMNSEKHCRLTGVHNERILENLKELLKQRYNVKIRMPLLKGLNDGEAEIKKAVSFLMPYRDYENFKGIDILPYHKLGVNKYKQIGMEYQTDGELQLSSSEIEIIEGWIKECNFSVSVIRH